jgi:hypothetical protein
LTLVKWPRSRRSARKVTELGGAPQGPLAKSLDRKVNLTDLGRNYYD